MDETTIRVGLVGYGLAGAVFHAPLIACTPGLRLVSVVTGNPERQARAAGEHPGVAVLRDADQLWEAAGAHDLVVLATPNTTHLPLGLAAVEAGLAVVVDKPLALTAADGRRLVEAAQRRGTPLTVFHNRRWDGDLRTGRPARPAPAGARAARRLRQVRPGRPGAGAAGGPPAGRAGLGPRATGPLGPPRRRRRAARGRDRARRVPALLRRAGGGAPQRRRTPGRSGRRGRRPRGARRRPPQRQRRHHGAAGLCRGDQMNQRMEPNSLWTPLPTQDERSAAGRALRRLVPRGALGRWRAAEDRPDP